MSDCWGDGWEVFELPLLPQPLKAMVTLAKNANAVFTIRPPAYLVWRVALWSTVVAGSYAALSDDALLGYLTGEASERDQRLRIDRSDGDWVAAFVAESGLGGEAVSLSVNGPDRRTAMLRLAELISQQS